MKESEQDQGERIMMKGGQKERTKAKRYKAPKEKEKARRREGGSKQACEPRVRNHDNSHQVVKVQHRKEGP